MSDGAVLAGLASIADKNLPTATKVFGALAVLALGAAAVLLLLVVRPRLRGDDKASFPYWARLDEDEIRACMDGDTRSGSRCRRPTGEPGADAAHVRPRR
ncbi:Pycsar system effector family protein [Streptomyces sp. NPDC002671]